MEHRVTMLRIKIASLAAEGRLIRKAENRKRKFRAANPIVAAEIAKRVATNERRLAGVQGRATRLETIEAPVFRPYYPEEVRNSLFKHRTVDVRREARCALLAYAYLKGKPYWAIEPTMKRPPNFVRVEEMARSFGGDLFVRKEFNAWVAQLTKPTEEEQKVG
jgi:hypothetical protein